MIARLFPLRITFPAPMTRSFPLTIAEALRYREGGDLRHLHHAAVKQISDLFDSTLQHELT